MQTLLFIVFAMMFLGTVANLYTVAKRKDPGLFLTVLVVNGFCTVVVLLAALNGVAT